MTLPAFIAWEAVQVANEGGLVVILTKHPRDVLTDLLNSGAQELFQAVRKANGNEGIDFLSGGQIAIVRSADRFRGYSAKLAIIPIGTSQDDMMSILPSIVANDGNMVGYY